jgi:hypothetical protein
VAQSSEIGLRPTDQPPNVSSARRRAPQGPRTGTGRIDERISPDMAIYRRMYSHSKNSPNRSL